VSSPVIAKSRSTITWASMHPPSRASEMMANDLPISGAALPVGPGTVLPSTIVPIVLTISAARAVSSGDACSSGHEPLRPLLPLRPVRHHARKQIEELRSMVCYRNMAKLVGHDVVDAFHGRLDKTLIEQKTAGR
jgi:hypothetical protein